MIYAYIRISTDKQDTDNQKLEILNYAQSHNFHINEIIEETISSRKKLSERNLHNLINKCKKNDIIITTELSRLGRSLMEVMEILKNLMDKNVKVIITKGNIILGDNIQSKVLAFAFGLSAEIERELISSRTQQALLKLKSEGKQLGRPTGRTSSSKLDNKINDIKTLLSKKVSVTSISKILECSQSTLRNFIKSRNLT